MRVKEMYFMTKYRPEGILFNVNAVIYFNLQLQLKFINNKYYINPIRNNQHMQLYAVNFIPLLSSLYMFRVAHTPIIRSTKFNCIYSHCYSHRLA